METTTIRIARQWLVIAVLLGALSLSSEGVDAWCPYMNWDTCVSVCDLNLGGCEWGCMPYLSIDPPYFDVCMNICQTTFFNCVDTCFIQCPPNP